MKNIKIITIIFLLFPTFIFSQTTENMFVVKEKGTKQHKIKPYIYIYEDANQSLDIEQVISHYKNNDFIKLDTISNKLEKKSTYWGRFEITSLLENDTYWFVNFVAPSSLRLNYLESYVFDKRGNQLNHSKFGYLSPASEISNPRQRDNFELHLPSKDTLIVYLKITNTTNWNPTFEVELSDKIYLSEKKNTRNLIKLFYEGILWIFILYNLLTFVISKDRIYLYYSLYFFGSALYTLFINKYLIFTILAEAPQLDTIFWLLSIGPGTIFYFMFMRRFTNMRELLKRKWNIIINTYIYVKISIVAIELLLLAITYNIPLISSITIYSNLAEFVLAIVFMIRLWRTRSKLAYYFIVGSLFLWVGFVAATVMFMMGNPYNSYVGEFGVAGELLVFALGLGYRIRKNEKEKQDVQQALISQLERNNRLKTKVNRELEQKVRERTEEITSQKDELEKQKDKITIQNKNILDKNKILNIQKREISAKNTFLKEKQEQILVQNEMLNQNREEILTQNEELEIQRNIEYIQKQKITDSILYAKRIQQAILPSPKKMKQIFGDYFVIYLPRDIVSGDFLWAKQIGSQKIIAVADCTGHGVPGAFVSMLGMALLNELIQKHSELKTNLILDKMRRHIKSSFNQENMFSETKDGLDIGLAIIDTENMKMQFSGAYNSLYLVRKNCPLAIDNTKFINLKGDRQPISIYVKEKPFTKQEIEIREDDLIYMSTDGYTDQFGENNRKFLLKRFKSLILENKDKPLKEQKQIFYKTHKDWKIGKNQIDDVLVVGIKI